ncbi:MAG: acyl carrier protein [Gemmatimonadota bacterium]|nr:acyl carrier protein [Gemmatimonadota bacterium]MDX2119749.1 acyl carrier protein [Gemmatimonadota bacterium]
MDQIIQPVKEYILSTYLKGEDPSALKDTTPLITGGILDSLGTLELVSFLEQRFGIQLEAHEVDAERLDTLQAIGSLVKSKTATV